MPILASALCMHYSYLFLPHMLSFVPLIYTPLLSWTLCRNAHVYSSIADVFWNSSYYMLPTIPDTTPPPFTFWYFEHVQYNVVIIYHRYTSEYYICCWVSSSFFLCYPHPLCTHTSMGWRIYFACNWTLWIRVCVRFLSTTNSFSLGVEASDRQRDIRPMELRTFLQPHP